MVWDARSTEKHPQNVSYGGTGVRVPLPCGEEVGAPSSFDDMMKGLSCVWRDGGRKSFKSVARSVTWANNRKLWGERRRTGSAVWVNIEGFT